MIKQKIIKNSLRVIIKTSIFSGLLTSIILLFLILAGVIKIPNYLGILFYAPIGFTFGFFVPLLVRLLLDVVLTNRALKRLPYLGRLALLALSVTAAMSVIYLAVGAVFSQTMFTRPGMTITGTMTLGMFLIVSSTTTVTEFLGRGFFSDMVLGRYHRARQEEKIFLFIDLRSSTALAECLTPVKFYDLLNDFLFVVEQCCQYYGGQIYKYLGDGVIAVWPAKPDNFPRAVNAMKDIETEIAEQNQAFRSKYGQALELTAGLHSGKILVGELGSFRKEIGYWGDTINTTQRIQAACKEKGITNLCSEEFYKGLLDSDSTVSAAAKFENVILRGKEQPMTLVSF